MSRVVEEEEEDDDDKRQYQCSMKFEKMVKQFDELIEMMDARIKPPRRRKTSKGNRSIDDTATPSQASNGEVLSQTITRFLHELNNIPAQRDSTLSYENQLYTLEY